MSLDKINHVSEEAARDIFMNCCTSQSWVERMISSRPYINTAELLDAAIQHWQNLAEADYLQAFDGHPKIGDPDSLKKKYANTKKLASGEQSSVKQASEETIQQLSDLNHKYYAKFGFIFIVFASGKTAQVMLQLLKDRIGNDRDTEVINAAQEQSKIFVLRLTNFLEAK